jgi:hypothetical protein
MPTITDPGNFANNTTADANAVNARFAAIFGSINGLDGANVAAALTGRRLVYAGFIAGALAGGSTYTNALLGPNGGSVPAWTYLDPANYAITGKANTQLILKASVTANTVAPGVSFTYSLNSVTFGGSSGIFTMTVGAAVAGGSVAIASGSIAQNAGAQGETAAFACPVAGFYAVVLNTSGAIANGFAGGTEARLFALNS